MTTFPHETCEKLTRQQTAAGGSGETMAAGGGGATLGRRRGAKFNITLNSLKTAQRRQDVSSEDFPFYGGCVSQSKCPDSRLRFDKLETRSPVNLATYLHADLIEHQASCVVEETVSLPAELHGVLVHLVQH